MMRIGLLGHGAVCAAALVRADGKTKAPAVAMSWRRCNLSCKSLTMFKVCLLGMSCGLIVNTEACGHHRKDTENLSLGRLLDERKPLRHAKTHQKPTDKICAGLDKPESHVAEQTRPT
jgi:hypothetical protein